MKFWCLLAAAAVAVSGQPRTDNVLVKMVPPGSTSLVSARMDQIKTTEFYRKLLEQQKLPQLERFAQETGFDPRRDVREMLFASTATGGVLLARGSFRVKQEPLKQSQAKLIRHGAYIIWSLGENGFCILDTTLAAAGDLKSLGAALDEWKSGKHAGAAGLLAHAKDVDPRAQFWGVSTGFASFLADHMPRPGGRAAGIDFSKIFRGLQETWFQADFSNGLKGDLHGVAAAEQDAVNLRDTAKGLVGFGRLSVPENQPEMLKLWDGIVVEQEGRSVTIRADIPQSLVDRLVQMLSSAPGTPGLGGRGLGGVPTPF
ncbi:MAG: hypothetical protein QOJ99_3190 [Bryobacterales bacterium]|nr:hypothetical protein [Bryobacterales bacterium]